MSCLVAGLKSNCFLWLKSGLAVRLIFSVLASWSRETLRGSNWFVICYLLVKIDFVFAVDIRVLVGQPSAVDDFEEKVNIFANKLVRTINKLVVLLRVLATLLITRSYLNLQQAHQTNLSFLVRSLRSSVLSCSLSGLLLPAAPSSPPCRRWAEGKPELTQC